MKAKRKNTMAWKTQTPNKKNAPCYNCPNKTIGCQQTCKDPDYLAKVERDQRVKEARAREIMINSTVTAGMLRNLRRKKQ